MQHNVWLEDAFDRARQLYLSYYRAIPKSLERATAHKLMMAMLDGDERFVEPTPQSLQKLTLPLVRDAVMDQFVGDNMEVSIVGDFTKDEVESCILDYLGTVKPKKSIVETDGNNEILFRTSPSDLQSQQISSFSSSLLPWSPLLPYPSCPPKLAFQHYFHTPPHIQDLAYQPCRTYPIRNPTQWTITTTYS
ncbi:hypothetical protein EJ110_NYTH52959 [Nymphaea thermarum]|nr:hypothetical protein EJ110_NYTH52959 [Nymphaea thermarum]